MKIGFFLPNATFDLPGTAEVGGIESFAFTVGEALQRLGHDVILFGGRPKAGRQHKATSLRLELHPYWETRSIPDLGTRFQRLVQRLHFGWKCRRALTRERCDLILLAKPFDWPLAFVFKRLGSPTCWVMGFHGTDFFPGDRLFYPAIDAAFAVSSRVADLAEKRVELRPALIPNPVDVEFFSPGKSRARAPGEAWRLVASGRLVGWKGFSQLIAAVHHLTVDHHLPVRLTLAGEGPERGLLEKQIVELSLQNTVSLTGRLDPTALRDLLRSGDVYVAPSIGLEAFSIAALEAGCVGLPLILSSQVGLGDFLQPDEFVSYAGGDVAKLAETLKAQFKVWASSGGSTCPDRDSLRIAQHAALRKRFAPEEVARQILELANEVKKSKEVCAEER